MEFFCYHRDRPGSTPLRNRMVEQHWEYMDGFDATMIARGPTFAEDEMLTGSVHVLGLPDPAAARAFAFDEPCYQAGAYRDVLVRRWRSWRTGTTAALAPSAPERERFLVLGFTLPRSAAEATEPPLPDSVLVGGLLLSDDAAVGIGAALLVETPSAEAARETLPEEYVGVEVHRWRPGGRRA